MIKYVAVAVFSGMLSAVAQVLLKKSSVIRHESVIHDYMNPYVIGGYGITVVCMVLMVYAYRGLPFKYGAVIESLVYLYIMVLSRIFFQEKITMRKLLGNCLIVFGVAIFGL